MGRIRHCAWLLALAALVISCGDHSADSDGRAPDDLLRRNPIVLQFGESIILPPDNTEITFASVRQDSRCPTGVYCFWEGMAEIALQVEQSSGDTHQVTMAIYGGSSTVTYQRLISVDTLGYRFMLLQLDPYPVHEQPIDDSDYVATLAIFPFEPFDSIDGEVLISDDSPASIQEDPFGLDTVFVAGDVMHLKVVYSGGCHDHEFELHMSPATFMESLPVQANLYLYHEDLDDPCDAIVSVDLTFDLRPIGHLYELMYDEPAAIQLNVYHYFEDTPGDKISVIYTYPQGYWAPEEHR